MTSCASAACDVGGASGRPMHCGRAAHRRRLPVVCARLASAAGQTASEQPVLVASLGRMLSRRVVQGSLATSPEGPKSLVGTDLGGAPAAITSSRCAPDRWRLAPDRWQCLPDPVAMRAGPLGSWCSPETARRRASPHPAPATRRHDPAGAPPRSNQIRSPENRSVAGSHGNRIRTSSETGSPLGGTPAHGPAFVPVSVATSKTP
jgi:hypothetical protein